MFAGYLAGFNITMKSTVQLVVVLELFSLTLGYPSGPPLTDFVCGDMFPVGHGADAQSSTAPFSIKLSQNVYTPWEELRISVSAKPNHVIRGLFVQARRAECTHPQQKEAVGTFQLLPSETYLQTVSCFDRINSSVSHRSNPGLLTAVFKWFAPAVSVGHLYFVATVVETKTSFWTNVYSEILRDLSTQSGAAICPARRLLDPTRPQVTTPIQLRTTEGNASTSSITPPFTAAILFCLVIVLATRDM